MSGSTPPAGPATFTPEQFQEISQRGWGHEFITDGHSRGRPIRHMVLSRRTPRRAGARASSGTTSPSARATTSPHSAQSPLSGWGSASAVTTPYGPRGHDRDREGAGGSLEFGELPSVQAMGTGKNAILVGFDTEFHYEDHRVLDSYQMCVPDPLDPSMMVEVVVLPLDGVPARFSTVLIATVQAAGLHQHLLAHRDFGPDGVGRRSYWSREVQARAEEEVAEEGLTGRDAREALKRRRDGLLFERALPVTLVSHFGTADLTTFRSDRYETDVLRRLTSAAGGLVSLRPFRVLGRGPRDQEYWRYPFSITVRDTITHAPAGQRSLADLGRACGEPKLDVPGDWITRMGDYREQHLGDFLDYGINDSRICVEFMSRLWGEGTAPPLTLSSAAARALETTVTEYWGFDQLPKSQRREAFRLRFGGLVKEGQGLVKIEREDRQSYYEQKGLVPSDGSANQMLSSSANAYHGGANGAGRIGFFPKKTYDLDLQNAYPTAMACVPDLDFEGGAVAQIIHEQPVDRYMIADPLTPFMGFVRFEFPASVTHPTIPVTVDGALIYPRSSEGINGVWVAGPELYVALQLGAEVWCQVGYFGRVLDIAPGEPSMALAHGVKQLIEDRNTAKKVFGKGSIEDNTLKTGVNSIYGKTAQDVSEQRAWDAFHQQMDAVGGSSITSPYHAAMTTSIVRAILLAVMNQLEAQGYEVYSWTTDGLITDAPVDVVEGLDMFGLVHPVRQARKFLVGDSTVWEAKHEQSDLLNFTTRGNTSLEPGGVNAHNGYKLPAGIQEDSAEDRALMRRLVACRTGRIENQDTRFPSFQDLSRLEGRQDFLPRAVTKRLSMDFDLKRKPVQDSMVPITVEVEGEDHEVATFNTEAWHTVAEARRGRELGKAEGRSGCLRTVDQWRTWFLKLDQGSVVGRRITDHRRAVVMSLLIGHRQGFFDIPNLGAKTNTQSWKLEWLSAWGLGQVSKSDWDNARRATRVSQMLPAETLEPWLTWMKNWPVGHMPSSVPNDIEDLAEAIAEAQVDRHLDRLAELEDLITRHVDGADQ